MRTRKELPPLLREGGPFEFISQPDPRHYIAKCKRCGKIIERGASYFYSKTVVSCGCANAERLNIQNKIDEKYIYQDKSGAYRLHIDRLKLNKTFRTLPDAIAYRDQAFVNNTANIRICVDCGKPFAGATSAKRCPDCREVYQRNWKRAKAGWTEDEIAAGKRVETRVILPGDRFGRLTTIEKQGWDQQRHATMWLCRCDCGNEVIAQSNNLLSEHTISCGCALKEAQQSPEKRIAALKASPNTGKFEQNLKAKSFRLSDGKREYICRNLSNFCRENPELFGLSPGDDAAAEREAKDLATSIDRYRCHGWTVERIKDCVCQRCGKHFPLLGKHAKFCPDCREEHQREKSRDNLRRKRGWTEEEIANNAREQSHRKYSPSTTPKVLMNNPAFDFIARVHDENGKLRYRVRCKACGKIIDRTPANFYQPLNSCGCLKNQSRPSEVGQHISAAHTQIKHICIKCGKEFQGGATSKYCPDCRGNSYKRDYQRRRAGWTEEEIRLGHRIRKQT